ncbi:hypothetical protein NDU88_007994 [Pleurodeles waltl]|uniref:Uncharacterized protein n=1 Tax=Pleurodeles waltl TaxID=8319 RepID=A0AAV7PV07_PLEWA|nr:hypothetical protein NDU88_007994 [Pleurodeles waltl]
MYTARVVRLDALCDYGPREVLQRVCSPRVATGHVPAYVFDLLCAVGGQTPSSAQCARPSALRIHSSWEPGGRALSRSRAPAQPLQDLTDPLGDKPGAGSRAPHELACAIQVHPRLTQLGRGRAGALHVQLTFPGTASGAAARTCGRHGSVN